MTFADWVYTGPMLNLNLQPHEIDHFGDKEMKTLLGMLPGLQDGFKHIAAIGMADIRSFDNVGLDVYLNMLRERVPGVKFGVVKNHKVEWE